MTSTVGMATRKIVSLIHHHSTLLFYGLRCLAWLCFNLLYTSATGMFVNVISLTTVQISYTNQLYNMPYLSQTKGIQNLTPPKHPRVLTVLTVGLDQICFFFYPFCFSFLLTFSTYFAFYCTHFAFNYTHFASHDEVMLHKFAAPIPSAILVDFSSCCSHQQ